MAPQQLQHRDGEREEQDLDDECEGRLRFVRMPDQCGRRAQGQQRHDRDSGTGDRLLRAADSVRVVDTLSWRYRDTPGLVAEGVGADPRQRLRSTAGGNSPQMLMNDAAAAVTRLTSLAGARACPTFRDMKR